MWRLRNLLFAVALGLAAIMPTGCNRGKPPALTTGPASPPGWEVRYNATIALARRGSDKVKEDHVWENLLEMLDEEQQLRNFRHQQKKGSDVQVADPGAAYLTVITTLQAVNELHRRRPELDLSGLKPALDKLASSSNLAVNTEAKRTQQLLATK